MALVENVKSAWKMWSVRIALVAGVIAGVIAANQTLALGLIYFLPEGPWRIVTAVALGLVIFVIPTIARLMKQDNLDDKP